MRLVIENLAKISKAEIMLDGITIIGGENNTGKSTIGKAVFSIFKSFYKIDDIVNINRCTELAEILFSSLEECKNNMIELIFVVEKSYFELEKFNDNYKNIFALDTTKEEEIEKLRKIVNEIYDELKNDYPELKLEFEGVVENAVDRIISTNLNVSNLSIKKTRLISCFKNVFNNQINNINSNLPTSIEAYIKDKKVFVNINGNSVEFNSDLVFTNSATLIDNPFIINKLYNRETDDYIPVNDLLLKLKEAARLANDIDKNLISKTIAQDKLTDVLNIFEKTLHGKLARSNSNKLSYIEEGNSQPTDIINLSAGLKSFVILQLLLECNQIKEKDVLILDEPEIHLHPEWQLIYAEIIVRLQKIFDLTVLITSHSPAFIRSIECFCDIYDRMDVLNVYKTVKDEKQKNCCILENISYSEYGVTELYEQLSQPFEELERLLEKKYGE